MVLTNRPGKVTKTIGQAPDAGLALAILPFAEQQIFDATFRSGVVGIAVIDATSRLVKVNDRFCELAGRGREELLTMTCYDITHPDDNLETQRGLDSLLDGADGFTLEKRYVRKDGSIVWVSNGVSAIRDAAGQLRGAIAIVIDINDRKVGEETARESDDRYNDLMEAIGVAVYTTDADGVITYFNEAAATLWGRRPELGKDEWCGSWRIYTTDGALLPHDQCPMAITLKENRPVRGAEAIAERPDGTRFNFMPIPTPLRDSSGQLIGAVNVLVDITGRRRAEADAAHQRDLVKTITENMSVGLFMVDATGHLEFMNPAAELITGYRFEEVRGRKAHDLLHHSRRDGSELIATECPIDQANKHGVPVECLEDVFVRPDGSFYDVVCNVAPLIQNGKHVGAIVDLRDATEEKKAQEAIRQSMTLKDQFLGLVSHELRTPISTVVGNALLLLRRSDALSPESKEQALVDIVGESQKLQRIVENLLLITRLEVGQPLETEPIQLQSIVNDAVASFRRRNSKRSISIESDIDVPVALGHPSVLPLVFENLISNADKYSPPEAPIEIRIYGSGDEIHVGFRDYGIGLDENEIEDIFTPFYRSPRARSHAPGIGLGLAVCRRVLEAQEGRVWAVARPEGGSDFTLSMRRASES